MQQGFTGNRRNYVMAVSQLSDAHFKVIFSIIDTDGV